MTILQLIKHVENNQRLDINFVGCLVYVLGKRVVVTLHLYFLLNPNAYVCILIQPLSVISSLS